MTIRNAQVHRLVSLVRVRFPEWDGFGHPDFVREETAYKRRAVEKAAGLLDRNTLFMLLESGRTTEFISRLERVGRDTNLLWNTVPSSGDLGILYHVGLGQLTFCSAVFDLLYGPDTSPERLERYVRTVQSLGLPNKWTFPTYFLFVCHPETELFVKPKTTGQFLKLIDAPFDLGGPSGAAYARVRELAFDLKDALAEYRPRDMIDVQSLIWVCDSVVREANPSAVSLQKWSELRDLFREFAQTYVPSEEGQRRQETYRQTHADAERTFAELLEAADRGEGVTGGALQQFVPYGQEPADEDGGASVQPPSVSVQDTLGATSTAWLTEAASLLHVVQRCMEQPGQANAFIGELAHSEHAQGMQATMISAILHALRPDHFLPAHAPSRQLINYFADTSYTTRLTDYVDLNKAGLRLIAGLKQEMAALDKDGLAPTDWFDLFCHWMPLERTYGFSRFHNLIVAEPTAAYDLSGPVEPDEPDVEPEIHAHYPLAECSAQTGVPEEELRQWVQAIERKKQAILYGPPGTGKTFTARQMARHLIGGGDGFVELVQFHPGYTYEEFIQGIRPQARPEGGLDYPTVPGRFLLFCREARTRTGRCVLIIDEINRANLAHVFGELMYLLEYRDQEIPLAGGGPFQIPENVRLIGTMNTADRSIALVDHALRRRFAFLPLYPNYDVLRAFHQRTGFPVEGLIRTLVYLNQQIADRHYEVGISFFLNEDLPAHLESIWRTEIEPYLEEYFFDQPEKADAFRWDAVRERMLE